jgi:Zn-dependent membrane protease YugP
MPSVSLTTFASQIVLWLPLLGLFAGLLNSRVALTLVAAAWGILMLFNLITLPVEFDASAKARLLLRESRLIQTEQEEAANEANEGLSTHKPSDQIRRSYPPLPSFPPVKNLLSLCPL